ncbi:MAG: hypothetical protein J3Q66DRAFT_366966 [Benniella sp.]|nr:MAG: hypothetical protein J3Q66DRAFT_366966 [Benniella sp.]
MCYNDAGTVREDDPEVGGRATPQLLFTLSPSLSILSLPTAPSSSTIQSHSHSASSSSSSSFEFMFDSLLLNNNASASASVPADPAPVPVSDPESFLFHSLFTMPINNTISQDFCLFPGESSFDFPLFNPAAAAASVAAKSVKPAALATAAPLSFYANPLCTPQTPSLDLPAAAPTSASASASLEGHGFDSCAALFLDDAASVSHQHLIDTPFTPFMDTPLLMDTPLDLFDDFSIDFFAPTTIEPQQVSFLPANHVVPSPASTMLSSPAESIDSDFASDDEFVPSRSAALVSGLKRKAADAVHPDAIKKPRAIDCLKKATAPKRFSCIHHGCDKSFARLFNLHTHEKTHDPEKARPFLCSDAACAKAFSRKHDLQRHEASVHKGERNFVCETCTKSFARQDGLRRHLAVKGPCFNNQWSAT